MAVLVTQLWPPNSLAVCAGVCGHVSRLGGSSSTGRTLCGCRSVFWRGRLEGGLRHPCSDVADRQGGPPPPQQPPSLFLQALVLSVLIPFLWVPSGWGEAHPQVQPLRYAGGRQLRKSQGSELLSMCREETWHVSIRSKAWTSISVCHSKGWRQPKCPPTGGWTDQPCTRAVERYPAMKKHRSPVHATPTGVTESLQHRTT